MPGLNLTRDEAIERASIIKRVHSYHIFLDLRTDQDVFTSNVEIRFDAQEGASTFIDAITSSVKSINLNGEELSTDLADGERIQLPNLAAENVLKIEAEMFYTNTGEGLHRFVDPADGEIYLYSQFEVPDSRRVFPVFEQPDLKATFEFEVRVPSHWVVVSNQPEVKVEPKDCGCGRANTWYFKPTPRMSSYITAIVAGPYEKITSELTNSEGRVIPLGVYARKSLMPFVDAEDMFELTRQGFEFYEEQFKTPYPFEKYDQLFVPEFNAGAMENAGCVTYLETYVFRSKVAEALRERRAITVLHELAHMWFGDMVTMTWWNDLWLNESFAEFMSHLALAEATKYTEGWTGFMVRKDWGLKQDQLPTTHPITAEIRDLADVEVNFDGITYAKGAAVLKQLVAWVGEDAFYDGARRYFDKHRFAATSLADLLEALEAASHQELGSWKSAWLETSGPSTLSASWRTDSVGAISDFTLHQSAEACGGVLRPHRVTVSTWRAASGALERTHVFDVRIDGESAPIDPDGVLALPGGAAFVDLVVINDDDLTYAISRLDERSTDVALAYVGTIGAPITRAVVWASLWNAVRDGLLDPRRFIVAVLNAVPAETEPAIRDRLLLFVSEALSSFLPGAARAEAHDQVLATTIRLAKDADDADAWRAYTRAFIAEFAARGGDEYEAAVRAFAASDNPDIAWRARRALAARGLVDEETILAWRDADGSGEAARMSVEALASIPDEAARARAWESVWSDALSNDYLSATLAGLQSSTWEGERGIGEAVARMRGYWESHTIGMSLRYVSGVLDLGVDIDREGSVEASVSLLRSWLGSNEDAPAQLRRIVVEHLDDFERRERVQRRWQGDQ